MRTLLLLATAGTLAAIPCAAAAQVVVTSSAVLERQADAGERYEGRIELTNSSSTQQEARLYKTDYTATADGRVSYEPAASRGRSNASWVTLSTPAVTLPPGGRTTVTYVVTVPAGQQLSGTYWSMIMVEGVDRAAEAAAASGAKAAVAIRTALRYGVQVATHVGADSKVLVAFDSVRAASEGQQRALSYDFVNTGERATRLRMSVELFGADGRPVRRLEQQRGLLYPGNSARQRFDFGALPAGTYTAIVTADAGSDEMIGAQYTLRF